MRALSILLVAVFFSTAAPGQVTEKTLPFTRQENLDDAKYVWFIFGKAGFPYRYVTANALPKSAHFRRVKSPQAGDVAWWPNFVAVVEMNNGSVSSYVTADGESTTQALESRLGKPRFYRYDINNAP